MQIRVIGTNCADKHDIFMLSGHASGICYMADNFDTIQNEPEEKTLRRANVVLESGHHSCYDHAYVNLLVEDIPKILAMVLNNENVYATSEKSARYTEMKISGREKELYDKWLKRIRLLIQEKHGERMLRFYKTEKKASYAITKLAMENARYMISVFAPATMLYSLTIRQLNYILGFFEKFCQKENKTDFEKQLALAMIEFSEKIPSEFKIDGLNAEKKNRELSLFANKIKTIGFKAHFEDIYSTFYIGSFAQLAQAQRHRTIRYKMDFIPGESYYIPSILQGDDEYEWLADIMSVKDIYPQGMNITIYESGTFDDFILKCYERLCGCAQLEIMEQTSATLVDYALYTGSAYIRDRLKLYSNGARCTFPCFKCTSGCPWGSHDSMERDI